MVFAYRELDSIKIVLQRSVQENALYCNALSQDSIQIQNFWLRKAA